MSWQMWLLISLLLAILVGLAGLAWMAWIQSRAISILRADLLSAKDQVVRSEGALLEALQGQGDHCQGVISYMREQVQASGQQAAAAENRAEQAEAQTLSLQRELTKAKAILARKGRRAGEGKILPAEPN